jgi:hypothetical protein
MINRFNVIIDTNKYAGNFVEELGAFITGLYDEDVGSGSEEAEIAYQEINKEFFKFYENEYVAVTDKDGYSKPVVIHTTPNEFDIIQGNKYPAYKSIAIKFFVCPTNEMLNNMFERAKIYAENNDFDILNLRVEQETTTIEEIFKLY